MNYRLLVVAIVLAVFAIVASLWQSSHSSHPSHPPQQTEIQMWSPEATYFFSDRSDSKWKFEYAIRGREVVVQQSIFPGDNDRKWYRTLNESDEIMGQIKKWAVRPGDTFPPFLPGGPWWCRISITPDETMPRGEAFFVHSNPSTGLWFRVLKREFVREESRVDILPMWISGDPRVSKYFGF